MNKINGTQVFRPAVRAALALSVITLCLSGNVMANSAIDHQQTALVGTWTTIPDAPSVQDPGKPSEGLYRLKVNDDGSLTPVETIKMKSPSWVQISRDGRFAYTTNEENAGAVTALALEKDGRVRVLNSVDSQGRQPTHAAISPDGKYLLVANYSVDKGGAGIAVFPIGKDGALANSVQHIAFDVGSGVVKGRQDSGHAHSVTFSPGGSYLYAADLGGDKLHAWRYRPEEAQPLLPDTSRDVAFAPGSGPRHMVFSRDGRHAYVITEMGGGVVIFDVADHRLRQKGVVPLNAENNSAEFKSGGGIVLSPDGNFIIAANRGSDNHLLVFKIAADGQLASPARYAAEGIEPRALSFDATGKYLYVANVFSNTISRFSFDKQTGELKPLGTAANIATPTDIKFFN